MSLFPRGCVSRHRWQWINEYNESPGIKQYRQCIDCGVRYHDLVGLGNKTGTFERALRAMREQG